jgi:hypothetical protein
MKYKLLYLSLLLGVLVAGCIKDAKQTTPIPAPSGTFTGVFKRLHRHTDKVPFDSVKATITLKLQTPAFLFNVTGDTTTVHAGSHGTWGVNQQYIQFNDSTFSAKSTKNHLSGYYLYNYDGTNLIMYASSSDTLVIGYSLKKTGN